MHPVDKVLIENWFICSLCLITSCLQGPWSSGIGAQHSQTRPGLGVLNADYRQLNSVSRTEAPWLPMHKQALGFPHHLIPVSMPRASSVSTGCSSRLLPLRHSPGTHPSHPILCTSFLPGRWAQPLYPSSPSPAHFWARLAATHALPGLSFPPAQPFFHTSFSNKPFSSNGRSWALVSPRTCFTHQAVLSFTFSDSCFRVTEGCSVGWGILDFRPSLDSES